MKKKLVILIPIVSIIVLAFCFWKNAERADKKFVLLDNCTNSVSDKGKNYFKRFQTSSGIQMFEFTDKESFKDTLQGWYVLGDVYTERQKNKIYGMLVEEIENYFSEENTKILSEIVDNMYIYFLCCERNGLVNEKEKELKVYLDNIFREILNIKGVTVEKVNLLYEYICICRILEYKKNDDKIKNEIKLLCEDEIEDDLISFKLILFSLYKITGQTIDENEIKQVVNIYNLQYENGEVEIEEFIIYTYFAFRTDLATMNDIQSEKIYNYLEEYFYVMSPTIRFFAYRILENIGYDLSNIDLLYQDFPNSDGILTCAAIIIPTYRRIFAYSEICDAMGIELDENLVKDYIQEIDNNSLGGQEVLYATLLDKKYKNIALKADIERQIKELYEQYESIDEIKDGNFFDCFSLLYTLPFYGVKDDKLFKKCLLYCEVSDYKNTGIVQVVKSIIELNYADTNKEFTLDNSFVGDFSDSSVVIDSYYWYVTYLNDSKKNMDSEKSDSIMKEIEEYHCDEGSWQSDIFKSINIFRTYQYLYIKQVLQKN